MKKLFTLAAAVLASFSLWAADPTLETTNWADGDFATVIANHDGITLSTDASAFKGNFSGTQYIALGGGCDLTNPANYLGITATEVIDSIEVFWAPNGTNNSNIAWAAWTDAANILKQDVDFMGQTDTYKGAKNLESAIWQKIDLTGKDAKAVLLTRQLKKAKLDGTVQSNLGDNQTVNVLGIRVWVNEVSDLTKATVKSISIDGEALEGFDAATLTYNIELPYGTVEIPTVTAKTGNKATVEITQAAALPGAATVVCTSADGTSETITYTINFTVKATASDDTYLSDLQVNGTTVEGFAFNSFNYNVQLGVYEEIKVTATPRDPNAQDVEITVNEEDKVVVIEVVAENGSKMYTYKIFYTRAAATELVEISDDTTWDWAEAGTKVPENTDETFLKRSDWFNFADVLPAPGENFKAASLEGMLQFANRDNNSYAQGHKLRFKTTVAGTVTVVFSNTGTKDTARNLFINNTDTEVGSKNTTKVTVEDFAVEAGEVLIEGKEMLDPIVDNMLRFYKVVFKKKSESTAIDNTEAEVKAVKRIVNGVLVIEKNGVKYNAQGAVVK